MNTNHTRLPGDEESCTEPKSVGEQVPDFELPGADEDGIQLFSLSDFTERGALILSFYPFDFSPVCTSQLCGFRDAEWLTVADNVDVVGVSVDSAYSHQQFRNEYGMEFPLLTDRVASLAEYFGVKYDSWENHPAVCQRAVFVLDDSHTIRYRWVTDNARNQPSLDDLQESVEWMQ